MIGRLEEVLQDTVNWGRKNSLWPYNFGISCCYVEMCTAFTSPHDVARFGAEVIRASPSGRLHGDCRHPFIKMAPVIQRLYEQLLEPKWVISMGPAPTPAACMTSTPWYRGGQVPAGRCLHSGLPPRPEAFLQALMLLQESIGKERRPLSWVVGIRGSTVPRCNPRRNASAASGST